MKQRSPDWYEEISRLQDKALLYVDLIESGNLDSDTGSALISGLEVASRCVQIKQVYDIRRENDMVLRALKFDREFLERIGINTKTGKYKC